MTCGEAKERNDGATVDLTRKVVTAVFPDEGCIYLADQNGYSGIRADFSGTGIAVGKILDLVGGNIVTMNSSEQTAYERKLIGAQFTNINRRPSPAPVAMSGKAVGGGETAFCAGVLNGFGLNSIGLLAKITGAVTSVDDGVVFIDDGSKLINSLDDGSERTGVMVQYFGNPDMAVGDFVSAAGNHQR